MTSFNAFDGGGGGGRDDIGAGINKPSKTMTEEHQFTGLDKTVADGCAGNQADIINPCRDKTVGDGCAGNQADIIDQCIELKFEQPQQSNEDFEISKILSNCAESNQICFENRDQHVEFTDEIKSPIFNGIDGNRSKKNNDKNTNKPASTSPLSYGASEPFVGQDHNALTDQCSSLNYVVNLSKTESVNVHSGGGRSFAKKRNVVHYNANSSKRFRHTNSVFSNSSRSSDEDGCKWNVVSQSISEPHCLNKCVSSSCQNVTNYNCYSTEELRKLQIRESNREAARRCRERRRLHIERLEEMVQDYENKITKLQADNNELHKEISRLKGCILQNMECSPATIIWKRLNGDMFYPLGLSSPLNLYSNENNKTPKTDKVRSCLNIKQLKKNDSLNVGVDCLNNKCDGESSSKLDVSIDLDDSQQQSISTANGCNAPLNLSNCQSMVPVAASIDNILSSRKIFSKYDIRIKTKEATVEEAGADLCDHCLQGGKHDYNNTMDDRNKRSPN